jgi:heme-degrading monooxygenase HmoA
MQIVKLRTSLNDEEFLKIAHEREPEFAANPAIIQKYYIKLNEPGYYGGVYIWESAEALQEFKKSQLAASIQEAYKGIEKPTIEIVDVLFQLRE